MTLTYADTELNVPTAEDSEWLAAAIPPADVFQFVYPDFVREVFSRTVLRFDHHPELSPLRQLRVGKLFWPTRSAARWATAHWLVTERQLETIRAAVFPDGGQPDEAQLVMTAKGTITAYMHMLPARPLAQVPGAVARGLHEMYLMTLVDDRYYWWWRHGRIDVHTMSTWESLYDLVANQLGITIDVEPVDAVYLRPSALFNSDDWNLPPLLDEVARQCGQKVVRDLDGTVRTVSAPVSRTQLDTNIAADYARLGGGLFALSI